MLVLLAAMCFVGAICMFFELTDLNEYAKNKKRSNIKAAISVCLLVLGILLTVLEFV